MPARRVRSASAPGFLLRSRLSVPAPVRQGGLQVSEVQRARMLHAALGILAEEGYERMSVARVTRRARVSRRTFYDVFSDREDCYLAMFDEALARVEVLIARAYTDERGAWRGKVRAGLGAFLGFLDEESGMCSLLIVDALGVGARVSERRAQILGRLGEMVGRDCSQARRLPGLTGEAVVGAVFSVIYARLLAKDSSPMLALCSELMGVIVLSYEGPAAARREIERPVPRVSHAAQALSRERAMTLVALDPLDGLKMRLTYRTLRVLTVIAEHPGASNREIGTAAEIGDQGQISKLLQRLEGLKLIVNTTSGNRDHPTGEPNAWHLTPRGEGVQQATRVDATDDGADTDLQLNATH